MTFFSKRKRKNDAPPPFPAWMMVLVAVGLVIVAALFFQSGRGSQNTALSLPQSDIEATATYIIQQATALAQGTPQPPQSAVDESIMLTATAIIESATRQASTPGS